MAAVDVRANMPGSIAEVLVTVGDSVVQGQELLIIESMKMEIPLESPIEGTISEILTEQGKHITEDEVLLKISP